MRLQCRPRETPARKFKRTGARRGRPLRVGAGTAFSFGTGIKSILPHSLAGALIRVNLKRLGRKTVESPAGRIKGQHRSAGTPAHKCPQRRWGLFLRAGSMPWAVLVDVHLHPGSGHIRRMVGIARIALRARHTGVTIAGIEPAAESLPWAIGRALADPARVVTNRTLHGLAQCGGGAGVPSQARSCSKTSPRSRMSIQRPHTGT